MSGLGASPQEPTAALVSAVESALGERSVTWRKPHTGLTAAQRFTVGFESGTSAFVKAAVEPDTAHWLRADHLMMTTVDPDLVPDVLAWTEADGHPVLVLEDLGDAYWPADHFRHNDDAAGPVRWEQGQIQYLFDALKRVAAQPVPLGLPGMADLKSQHWSALAENPTSFLALDLCSPQWFEMSAARLADAEAALDLGGNALVHNNVRSDNACFRGDRVLPW
jgi:hypothetical protein